MSYESLSQRRTLAGFVVLLVAALAAPAIAAEMLNGDQVRSLVGGNTVQGAMEATGDYSEFYAGDGTIRGNGYTGAWTVEGDTMCFQYGSDPKSCWQVGREGDQLQWIKDGRVEGTGTIVAGNPNNF